MISSYQLENRVYDFFDTIYQDDKSIFLFDNSASGSFIVGRYYDTPRPSASTILVFDLKSIMPLGSSLSSDEVVLDRVTREEYINMIRQANVTVNIISKYKGCAKDAMSFLLAGLQTTRGNEASYPSMSASSFDISCVNVTDIKDLSEVENSMWTERVEAEFYFQFKDRLSFGSQSFIDAPSSVYLTKNKIDYDIDMI